MIKQITDKKEVNKWCLVCGDITKGHPKLDEIYTEMFNNGCRVFYSEGTN